MLPSPPIDDVVCLLCIELPIECGKSAVSTNLRKNTDLNDLVGGQFCKGHCAVSYLINAIVLLVCPRLQVVGVDAECIATLMPHNAVHRDFAVMVYIRKAMCGDVLIVLVYLAVASIPVR